VNHNKLITEELRAITNLMSYDRSKTLMEQPESVMDRRLGITAKNAKALGMSEKEYEKEMNKAMFGGGEVTWNHETAGYVELILTIGGFLAAATVVGAPLGALMIAGGTAIGVADALVYFNENDPYMGTMMLALQLIPGGELVSVLKKSGRFLKFGDDVAKYINGLTPKQMKALIDKGKESFEQLTDFQKQVLRALKEGVEDTAPKIVKEVTKITVKAFKTKLGQFALKKVLGSIVGLGKIVVKVAGVAIGVDKLWTLMSTPESWRTKMRNKAEFSKIMDMLYEGTLDDTLINGMWVIWQKLWNSDGSPNTEGIEEIKQDLINGNIDENLFDNANEETINDVVFNYDKYIKGLNNPWKSNNETIDRMESNYSPVTFNNLLNGRQTIRKGQKGDVVRDIQRMLVTIGYKLGNTGKRGDGVDGDFGESTEASIYELQLDHNLDGVDGIVGQETAKKLKELYNEKRR